MSDDWQNKMAALLSEYDEKFCNQPSFGTRVCITDMNGKMITNPEWLLNYKYPNIEKIKQFTKGN